MERREIETERERERERGKERMIKGREGSELNALVCANYHSIKQFCTMGADTCPTYLVGDYDSATLFLW